jgi:putative Holliday junction resolvase
VKLLGVDYGKKRTGLAISDVAGVTCRPLTILTEREMASLTRAVAEVAAEHEVEGIVVGVPRPLSGGTNQQLEDVLQFVERLRCDSALPVATWDERFTSVLAVRGRRGTQPIDAVAACYMLQNYLDRLSARGGS